jgi:hypothetical protein
MKRIVFFFLLCVIATTLLADVSVPAISYEQALQEHELFRDEMKRLFQESINDGSSKTAWGATFGQDHQKANVPFDHLLIM